MGTDAAQGRAALHFLEDHAAPPRVIRGFLNKTSALWVLKKITNCRFEVFYLTDAMIVEALLPKWTSVSQLPCKPGGE